MKVQISICGVNLDDALDSYATLALNAMGDETEDTDLGKTEVVKGTANPVWEKSFQVDYEDGRRMTIGVYKEDDPFNAMGHRSFSIGEILEKKGHVVAKPMSRGGIIVAHAMEITEATGSLKLKMRGKDLKNLEGFTKLRKSDPFFVLQRPQQNDEGVTWEEVYKSETEKDKLCPDWDEADIEIGLLCSGDLDTPIRVIVYDQEKDGKHELMGYFAMTVNNFLSAQSAGGSVPLKKGDDKTGDIYIERAELVGYTDPKEIAKNAMQAGAKVEIAQIVAEEKAKAAAEAAEEAEAARIVAEEKAAAAQIAAEEAEAAKAAAEEAAAALET